MNIIDFIEARISEDERIARAARPGPWTDDHGDTGPRIGDDHLMMPTDGIAPCNDEIPLTDSAHIARHDPARVLRQCAALRLVLQLTAYLGDPVYDNDLMNGIAAIWSDHPDFDTSWND